MLICKKTHTGGRPVLTFYSISNSILNKVIDNNILTVEYGKYPQKAVFEKILFAGVQFYNKRYKGNFELTNIKEFLNMQFAKDIVSSNINLKLNISYLDSNNENAIIDDIALFIISKKVLWRETI